MTAATSSNAAAAATWTWAYSVSLVVSVAAHFAIFAWDPDFRAGTMAHGSSELHAIEMTPPEIDIPPPPQAIARPAMPVISSAKIDENITIAPTTFEANPVSSLTPPPAASAPQSDDLIAAPRFTPYTVRPELKNLDAVKELLVRHYPPMLRDAGIGGTVLLWVFIDEEGVVQRFLVKTSSGYSGFDDAALVVAPGMKFTPAINRDHRVKVWIELPLVFSSR